MIEGGNFVIEGGGNFIRAGRVSVRVIRDDAIL